MRRVAWVLGAPRVTVVLLGVVVIVLGIAASATPRAGASTVDAVGAPVSLLLVALLGLNQLAALLGELASRPHRLAHMLSHAAAVLVLLSGSLSHWGSRHGRVTIAEKSVARALDLGANELRVQWGDGRTEVVPLEAVPGCGPVALRSADAPGLRITEVLEDAELRTVLGPGSAADGPGVSLRFRSHSAIYETWLLGDTPYFRRKDIGPVEVEHVVARDAARLQLQLAAEHNEAARITVQLAADDALVEIELPQDLDVEKVVGDTTVVARRFLVHARLDGEQLTDDPEAPVNPAAVLEVRRGAVVETHTVFSRFPEFNLASGRTGDGLLTAVALSANGVRTKTLVRVLTDLDGGHWVQLQAPTERGAAWPLRVGRSVVLGNLNLDVVLEAALPHATPTAVPQPVDVPGSGATWIHAEVGTADDMAAGWIRRETHLTLTTREGPVTLMFRPRAEELPFSIALRSVAEELVPGTRQVLRYRSQVGLAGPDQRPVEASVASDRPLVYQGFRIQQAGFVPGVEGTPDATVLQVSRDPAAPALFVALVSLLAGAGWLLVRRGRRAADDPADAVSKPGDRRSAGSVARSVLLALLAATPAITQSPPAVPVEVTRGWAVQAGGRVQPLASWAAEQIVAITGRSTIDGHGPLDFIWSVHFTPELQRQRPWVAVFDQELRSSLGLPRDRSRFSFDELFGNEMFRQHVEAAQPPHAEGVTPLPVARSALAVYQRIEAFAAIIDGSALRLLPTARADGTWGSIAELRSDGSDKARQLLVELDAMAEAYKGRRAERFGAHAGSFARLVATGVDPASIAGASLKWELLYLDLDAFNLAWPAYLMAAIASLLLRRWSTRWGRRLALGFLVAGVAVHTTGLVLRWCVTGWAPVFSPYESLLVTSWAAAALGLWLAVRAGSRALVACAAVTSSLVLLLAQATPLDVSLQPLGAPLTASVWSAARGIAIALAFGSLLLASALGHAAIGAWVGRAAGPVQDPRLSERVQWVLLLGLAFLLAGILFEAGSAIGTTGRPWNWTAQNAWLLGVALLTLLLALASTRAVNWLGPFGHAVAVIVALPTVTLHGLVVGVLLPPTVAPDGLDRTLQYGAAVWLAVEILFAGLCTVYRRMLRAAAESSPEPSRRASDGLTRRA